MKQYFIVLGKYANFTGRARRKEFWTFSFYNLIFTFAAALLDTMLEITFDDLPYGWFYLLYGLVILLPNLAVIVRRLHDVGKSGWFWFINLIPFIGSIWLLILFATDGDQGENQYGPNPKQVLASTEEMMTCSCGNVIPVNSTTCPVCGRMYIQPNPYPAMQGVFVPPPQTQPQRKQKTGSPKAEYAYSLIRIGQKREALPVLKELVREEPDNEKAWLSLYLCVDRKEQQKYCLQQALRINPGNKKAQQRLGKLYIPAASLQNGDNSAAAKNTPLICAQCNMPLSPESLFCEHCGNPVIEEDTLLDDPLPPARLPGAKYSSGYLAQGAAVYPPAHFRPQIQQEQKPGAGRVFLAFLILMITYFVLSFGKGLAIPFIVNLMDFKVLRIVLMISQFLCAFFTPLTIRGMKIRRWQAALGFILVIALDILIAKLRWGGMVNIDSALVTLAAGMLGVTVFIKSRRKLAAAAPKTVYISPAIQQPVHGAANAPVQETRKLTAKRVISAIGLLILTASGAFPWIFHGTITFGINKTEPAIGFETVEGAISAGLGLFSLILLFSIHKEKSAHLWATFFSFIAGGIAIYYKESQNWGMRHSLFSSSFRQMGIGPYLAIAGVAIVLLCIFLPSRKDAASIYSLAGLSS